MFTQPQPAVPAVLLGRPAGEHSSTSAAEYKDGIPVIAVPEDRHARQASAIEVLSPVLVASVEYAMDGVTLILRDALRTLAKRWPLRYGFMEEAEEAVRATLEHPRRDLYTTTSSAPELELVDGKVPLYLLCYHQSCSDALAHLKYHLPFSGRNWVVQVLGRWERLLCSGLRDHDGRRVLGIFRQVVVGLRGHYFRDPA
ncbi:hypothetical protein DAEQUDRAFT_739324 [Daedalea quercina L-15889]|uniref:Uncharacterized protein n=1 Tax=Daedalea quercina L-15889 TaxID=1314783 RepID=A0A165NZE2_9APHY|nr:hypothetical protein DAEQUDRAFT_739324 [Daedalea quercina L-15889]